MSSDTPHKFTNALIKETSPYLLQHAHNPVDWFPWGEEALQKSKKEDKPILLSIGYSACHWCHVMERESFENEAIAKIMNEQFICIKVDREERPDLDEIYMSATVAMNKGQGGWPMTVFLNPEQEPFFTGTYFPPENRYGRPGFTTVLQKISDLWKNKREELIRQGKTLIEHLNQIAVTAPAQSIGTTEIDQAATQLAREFDHSHGGFGHAPKFPPSTALSLLLRSHHRSQDPFSLKMVRQTLDAMAKGGMYDQIGGGFSRYSTDEKWLVPHFEKMLYDNALLAKIYLEGFQVTQDPFYQQIAIEILDYILREMTSSEGGFYSSTDADSEGEEGKFFVWTPSEIRSVLKDEESQHFCAYYDITDQGNWEGKSIPNTPRSMEQVAKQLGITKEALQASLLSSRLKIYEERSKRVHPGLDDKILTSWNGLMIGAMAEGARIIGDPRYLKAAEGAANFIWSTLRDRESCLLRTYRSGKAHLNACLEDYAFLCEGLILLYEAGGTTSFLNMSISLGERILSEFMPTNGGGFYNTSKDHERLILRYREGQDGAIPNPNASAAHALALLSYFTSRNDFEKASRAAIMAYGNVIGRVSRAFCKSLAVADLLLENPLELVIAGKKNAPQTEALRKEINRYYLPNRILLHLDPSEDPQILPLLEGKTIINGKPALYICYQQTCQPPITEANQILPALKAQEKTLRATRKIAL